MPSRTRPSRRADNNPPFSPTMFYKLINPNAPTLSLSAGIYQDSQGGINFTDNGSRSSENWQLFEQSGRYFIRNYDYGSQYQLGLTSQSPQTPKLYARTGKVEQQWDLVAQGNGWVLRNGLWPNGSSLNLPKGYSLPAMRSESGGEVWSITANAEATTSKTLEGDWISPVQGFESPSPSPSPSSALSSSLPAGRTVEATPIGTTQVLVTGGPAKSGTPSLSTGVIVAIALVSAVALLSMILGALCLIKRRRKKKQNPYVNGQVHEVDVSNTPRPMLETKDMYAHTAEMETRPVELPGHEAVELRGSDGHELEPGHRGDPGVQDKTKSVEGMRG